MRRLFWLVLGVTVGVLLVRRLDRLARRATPAGVSEGLAGVASSLREVADVVRESMAAREVELRAALTADATPAAPDEGSPYRRSH